MRWFPDSNPRGVEFDVRVVELDAILHYAGRILHPGKLREPGSLPGQAYSPQSAAC